MTVLQPTQNWRICLLMVVFCWLSSMTFAVARTLTVFAAASLTEAFTDIAAAFEADNPGVTVLLNVAGSSTLRTQIEQGAPADVFASANVFHMDALTAAGLVTDGQLFAGNRLVIVSQPEADIQALTDLAQADVRLVLHDDIKATKARDMSDIEASATTLGATPWQVFWHISLPLARPALIEGSLLA